MIPGIRQLETKTHLIKMWKGHENRSPEPKRKKNDGVTVLSEQDR
jgi:hypothetical protein